MGTDRNACMITVSGSYGHNIKAAFEKTRIVVSPNSDVAVCVQSAIDLCTYSLQQDIDRSKDSDTIDCISNKYQEITVPDDFKEAP